MPDFLAFFLTFIELASTRPYLLGVFPSPAEFVSTSRHDLSFYEDLADVCSQLAQRYPSGSNSTADTHIAWIHQVTQVAFLGSYEPITIDNSDSQGVGY